MDSRSRRRGRGAGSSRPGYSTRAGRGAGAARTGRTVRSSTADIGVDGGAGPGTGRFGADGAVRPVSRSGRAAGSRPAATRPGTAPPAAATGGGRRMGRITARGVPAQKPVRSPSRLAKQVAVLGLVFCAVALTLAVPLRNYLAQRAALGESVSHEQQLRLQLAALEQQKGALTDPVYIELEAKRRLQYVKPGDTVYVVHAPPLAPVRTATATAGAAAAPWYSPLWDTLSDPVVTNPKRAPAVPPAPAVSTAPPRTSGTSTSTAATAGSAGATAGR